MKIIEFHCPPAGIVSRQKEIEMIKNHKIPMCQICHKKEAVYAVQNVGGAVTAYMLGWYIRGFPVIKKVCDKCLPDFKEKLQQEIIESQTVVPERKEKL